MSDQNTSQAKVEPSDSKNDSSQPQAESSAEPKVEPEPSQSKLQVSQSPSKLGKFASKMESALSKITASQTTVDSGHSKLEPSSSKQQLSESQMEPSPSALQLAKSKAGQSQTKGDQQSDKDDNKSVTISMISKNTSEENEESSDTPQSDSQDPRMRKSSFGFDDYKFERTVLDENADALLMAELDAIDDSAKFIEKARLKTTEYSKVDIVRMASQYQGLPLDDSLVEQVLIPEEADERQEAVQEIYGPNVKPDSEPYRDPVTAMEVEQEENEDRVKSPPNLYDALQSNFLKSNYKTSMYRLFLLGTHDEALSSIIDYFRDLVENINTQSYTEPLQGVLCVYEYYYIHILEGSEDNLIKLMQKLVNDTEPSGYEWDLKFHIKSERYTAREHVKLHTVQSWVLGIFRIMERQFSAWRGEKVFPNKMAYPDIPPGGFREKYFQFLRSCMVMAFTYNRMAPSGFNPAPENNEEVTPQLKKTYERAKIQRFKSLGKVVAPITYIQYVLDHKDNPKLKIRSVREHLELFGGTPPYITSSNTEWPAPGRIAPYD